MKKVSFFFTKIIFVSTKIEKKESIKLSKKFGNKIKIIKRQNIGYDVYSFKIGWEFFFNKFNKKLKNKNLFFINSSILFVNPNKIISLFARTKIKDNEFYGISRSLEHSDHIQAYIYFFSANLFNNKNILNWWKKIRQIKTHYKVVLIYELGLTKLMIKNKVKLINFYNRNLELKTNNILKKIHQRFKEVFFKTPKYYKKDPLNYFWYDIIKLYGIVKIRLIKENDQRYNLNKLFDILKKKKILNEALNN